MDISELKEWAETHDIANRTIVSFKELLDSYKLDDPIEYAKVMKGIGKEKLLYEVGTISLNLGNWPDCSCNTISTLMRAFFDEKHIVNYRVYFLFSGEIEDYKVNFF